MKHSIQNFDSAVIPVKNVASINFNLKFQSCQNSHQNGQKSNHACLPHLNLNKPQNFKSNNYQWEWRWIAIRFHFYFFWKVLLFGLLNAVAILLRISQLVLVYPKYQRMEAAWNIISFHQGRGRIKPIWTCQQPWHSCHWNFTASTNPYIFKINLCGSKHESETLLSLFVWLLPHIIGKIWLGLFIGRCYQSDL